MSGRSSAESEGWTTGSSEPDSGTSSSASRTRGDEPCSPITGPESPSTRTFVKSQKARDLVVLEVNLCGRGEGARPEIDSLASLRAASGGSSRSLLLIFSAEDSRVKTSAPPDDEPASPGSDPDSSSSSPGSSTLFDPDGFSSRTYLVSSLATAVGTSEQCLARWPTSGTAWPGGFSTHVSSECRSDEGGCSSSEPSLEEIVEPPQNVPAKYSLSARAARGILRRARKRGLKLPSHLSAALEQVAQTTTTGRADG